MTTHNYEGLCVKLAQEWAAGNKDYVRNRIRGMDNRAEAGFVAACLVAGIYKERGLESACEFLEFLDPKHKTEKKKGHVNHAK